MNSTPPSAIGCRIVGEFDDDARDFAEAEFVPPDALLARPSDAPSLVAGRPAFLPPSEEALAAARQFWLKVIRRFTEPVPGRKRYVRVRDSGVPNRGRIEVDCGRGWAGLSDLDASRLPRNHLSAHELDVSDKLCLVLFRRDEPSPGDADNDAWVSEVSIPVPWTEVVRLRFEVQRPAQPDQTARATA